MAKQQSPAFRRIRSVLDRSPHFSALPPEKLDRLAAHGRLVSYKSGELVLDAWRPAQRLIVLLRGGLRVSMPKADGTSFIVAVIGEGTFVSPASLVEHKPYMVDAYAIGRTEGAEFRLQELRGEFRGDPLIEHHVRAQLLAILEALTDMHRDAVALPLAQALPRRLLAQALSAGKAWEHDREIELRVLQTDLAEMLGASRTRVGAELKRLEQAGVLRLGYRRVIVRNMTKLCAAAGKGVVPL